MSQILLGFHTQLILVYLEITFFQSPSLRLFFINIVGTNYKLNAVAKPFLLKYDAQNKI